MGAPPLDESEDVSPSTLTEWIRTKRWRAVATWIRLRCPFWARQGEFGAMDAAFQVLPDSVVRRSAGLCYWRGLSITFFNPLLAQQYYERAFGMYEARGDISNQWCCVAGMLDAVLLEYRDLGDMDRWFLWIDSRPHGEERRLIGPERSAVIASIYLAFVFRRPAHPRLNYWRTHVLRLADAESQNPLGLRLGLELVTDFTWRGDLEQAQLALDRISNQLQAGRDEDQETRFGSLLGHISVATHRMHTADREGCLAAIEAGLACADRLNCHVWDSILLCHGVSVNCSAGFYAEATQYLTRAEALRANGHVFDEAYYRGMRQWLAYCREDSELGVEALVDSSLVATDLKGVPYFQSVGRLAAAAALHQSGDVVRSQALVAEASEMADAMGNRLLHWMVGLLRAHFAYIAHDIELGDQELSAALRLGAKQGYLTSFCWPRRIVLTLLDRATELDIDVEYVQRLSSLHNLRPPGNSARARGWGFPVEIRFFDRQVLWIGGEHEPRWPSSAPKQAELFAVLIRHGGENVPIRTVVSQMYETDTEDGRNNVKGLLRNFRSRASVETVRVKNNELSIVWDNVRIDAVVLDNLIRQRVGAEIVDDWLEENYRCHFLDAYDDTAPSIYGCKEYYRGLRRKYGGSGL